MSLPAAAHDEEGNTLRLYVVGAASEETPTHQFDAEWIWRQVWDEEHQAVRVVIV